MRGENDRQIRMRENLIFSKTCQNRYRRNQRLRLLLLRCYYRKTRWVNATEDIENLLPGHRVGMLPALRAIANGQWRPEGSGLELLQRIIAVFVMCIVRALSG